MAFYVLSAMNAGGILGRLVPPILSDRLGAFNVFVPCAALTGLSMLLLWPFTKHLPGIVVLAVLYGFFSGAFNALVFPSGVCAIGTPVGVAPAGDLMVKELCTYSASNIFCSPESCVYAGRAGCGCAVRGGGRGRVAGSRSGSEEIVPW